MEIKGASDFLQLPWEIQTVLAGGYCAYLVSYVGIRSRHKAADTVFASLAFGVFGIAALESANSFPPWARIGIAFLAPMFAGVLWRVVGRDLWRQALRKFDYSWADDSESAWERLQADTSCFYRQISVLRSDGTWLFCQDTMSTEGRPFAPVILGSNGDVLMYVDKSESCSGDITEFNDVHDPETGSMITYIPSEQIKQISFRLKPRKD